MAPAMRFHVHHALLIVLCCACKSSQQQTATSTSMPRVPRGDLPTVTIATPSAWVDISASIPTNLGTDKVVVTSASVGGLPQIYLGASIAASAHAAVQSNCSQANSPDCQSSVENAIKTDNTLEARVVPILLLIGVATALISMALVFNRVDDVNTQPRLVNFQPEGYKQMIAAQSSSSVVFVTASDDPNPVTIPLITTSSWVTSATPTDSVVISTATTDGPGYVSGDSFIKIPTVDVAPLATILTATQNGAACSSPSAHINKPLEDRGSVDSLIDWGSSVGDGVKIWQQLAPGRELQLLRTAQDLELRPFVPALVLAAQQVVTQGQRLTHLVLSSTGLMGLIAVATIVLIIAAVIQNCLVSDGNTFLIPREAFKDTEISTQSSTSGASCPAETLQPICMNCGGNAGSSSCLGIKTRSNLWQDCPCYDVAVYKYPPDYQIALVPTPPAPTSPAPTSPAPISPKPQTTGQVTSGQLICETTGASPAAGDVTAAINKLKGLGSTTTCVQKNPFVSKCTTMVSFGSAAISICGPLGITTWCYLAAQWAQHIQNACPNGGRIGGQDMFTFDGRQVRIEVIHSEPAPGYGRGIGRLPGEIRDLGT